MERNKARRAELFDLLAAVTKPDEKCSGARVRINVQHDCWSTPTHRSAFGVHITWADGAGVVQRRFMQLLDIPTEVAESTAAELASLLTGVFDPLLEGGTTLEDIIATSTSDTESTAMKVR